MARRRNDIDELAGRIVRLREADRAKLLARLIASGGGPADWSVLREIRRGVRTRNARLIQRDAIEATREVRRERSRPA